MVEHMSDFALDELILAPDARHPHLAGCGQCQRRLQDRIRDYDEVTARPEFRRTFHRVLSTHERKRSWWPHVVGGLVTAGAALLLATLVLPGSPVESGRIKGSSRVTVMRGHHPASIVAQGDRIALVVSPAGRRHAVLVAVDEDGEVSPLWPVSAAFSGRLSGAASERLEPDFRITPGSFTVHAIYTEAPVAVEVAAEHVRKAIMDARSRGQSPLDVLVAPLSPSAGVASYVVRVRSQR